MNIFVDFDNTIADFNTEFAKVVTKNWFEFHSNEITCYDLVQCTGLSRKYVDETIFLAQRNTLDFDEIEGAISGLEKLKSMGHEIIIVSARPSSQRQLLYHWLNNRILWHSNSIVTGLETERGFVGKVISITSMKGYSLPTVLIDDNITELAEAADICPEWHLIKFVRSHNKDVKPKFLNCANADGWDDVVKIVREISKAL